MSLESADSHDSDVLCEKIESWENSSFSSLQQWVSRHMCFQLEEFGGSVITTSYCLLGPFILMDKCMHSPFYRLGAVVGIWWASSSRVIQPIQRSIAH